MHSSSTTLAMGPLSLRYAPSKVSPVWAFTRRIRRKAMGGRATAYAIDGQAAHPAIKDKNRRRSIVLSELAQTLEQRHCRNRSTISSSLTLRNARAAPRHVEKEGAEFKIGATP